MLRGSGEACVFFYNVGGTKQEIERQVQVLGANFTVRSHVQEYCAVTSDFIENKGNTLIDTIENLLAKLYLRSGKGLEWEDPTWRFV